MINLNQLKNKLFLIILIIPIFLATFNLPAYAATLDDPTANTEANTKIKIIATDETGSLAKLTFSKIVSGAITLVMILVSVVFFFILVMGGLKWVTSGGDEKKVAAARSQITNGLIGLAIVFAAYAIMRLIGQVFGINVFELSIPSLTGTPTINTTGDAGRG